MVHPALNLSTLDAGILIMVQKFSLNMVDNFMSVPWVVVASRILVSAQVTIVKVLLLSLTNNIMIKVKQNHKKMKMNVKVHNFLEQ